MKYPTILSVRVPSDVRAALDVRAKSLGVDTPDLARAVLCAAATMPIRVQTVERQAVTVPVKVG